MFEDAVPDEQSARTGPGWPPPDVPTPEPVAVGTATQVSARPPLTVEQWVAIAAGCGAVIGAFMPWASVTTIFGGMSRNGVDNGGDGLLTAALGVLGALAAWKLGKWLWLVVIGGVVIAAVGIYDFADISSSASEVSSDTDGLAVASVGSGLYVTIAAGVAMFVAGATVWSKRRNAGLITPP